MTERTVTPATSFTGYPDGITKQEFIEGQPVPVPAAYAALLERKGMIEKPKKSKASPDKD